MFAKKREVFEAKGELKDKEGNIYSPVNLSIWQSFDGSLKSIFKINPDDLGEFRINSERRFDFEGEIGDDYLLSFEEGALVEPLGFGKNPIEIGIKPLRFEMKTQDMKDNYSDVFLKFGITNFRNHKNKVKIKSNIAEIDFNNIKINQKEHGEIIQEIKNNNKACMTTEVYWKNIDMDFSNPKDCLSNCEKEMERILNLSGFAQGINQGLTFSKFFTSGDSGIELIFGKFFTPIQQIRRFNEVIHRFDMKKYLSKVYPNCDNLFEKMDLDISVDWYIRSIQETNVYHKFLKGFICLETLVDRFAKLNDLEFVTPPEEFKSFFDNEIQPVVSDLLKEFGMTKNNQRAEIYTGMKYSFRRKFVDKLKKLLEKHEIGYKDLFSNLNEITKTRNKIVHEGSPEESFDAVLKMWRSVMCLNQRIILSLLDYDGGRFQYWIADKKMKIFNRDPQGEYS